MATDKEKALAKIKKCLALAASPNQHEAATALRQAQLLMVKYDLSQSDILASEVSQSAARAGAKRSPAHWESSLATTIGMAFGCRVIHSGGRVQNGEWLFVGTGAGPEVSRYAFQVLLRQIKRDRAAYITKKLYRCKGTTKTKRADLFCNAWCHSIGKTIMAFASPIKHADSIAAYMDQKFGEIGELKSRHRIESNDKLSHRDLADMAYGLIEGRKAQLNRGVTTMSLDANFGYHP